MHRFRRILAIVLLAGLAGAARAGEVRVAVAANFAGALAKIGEGFTASSGHTLKVSSGATGKFYTQIQSGAPFEVLVAADHETPAKLVQEGHAVAGTAFPYAIGKLVLWSATPGLVDGEGAVLAGGKFRHVAVANPKVAPYGAAAYQVLKARGLADRLANRIVIGESIAQAYQFAASGNAELAFVALSQVAVPGKPAAGSWWVVPPNLYGDIRQAAVLLKAGQKNPAAGAFLAYLKGPAARQVIESYGYASPAP